MREIISYLKSSPDGKNSLSGKDILGDFFEGIIREGFKQIKGQFFAHINIFVKDGLLTFNFYEKSAPNALNESAKDQFYKSKERQICINS